MDDIFRSAHHRRIFFLAVGASLIVLLVFRLKLEEELVLTTARPALLTAISVTDNVISGLVASIIVGVTLYFFTPKRMSKEGLQQLHASEIAASIDRALEGTSTWFFLGNRGRYLRSVVLPALAKRRDGVFNVQAILCIPFNFDLCRKFAEYKKLDPRDDEGGEWTPERVQSEIFAAMVVCLWYARLPNLSVTLWLSETFSPIRFDSSQHISFLTAENKREPCLVVREGHFYNDWLLSQFNVSKLQSKQLQHIHLQFSSLDSITVEEIKNLSIFLGYPDLSSVVLEQSLTLIRNNPNPFS